MAKYCVHHGEMRAERRLAFAASGQGFPREGGVHVLHHPTITMGNNNTCREQTGMEYIACHLNDLGRRGGKVERLARHLQPAYTRSVAAFLRESGSSEPSCHHGGW